MRGVAFFLQKFAHGLHASVGIGLAIRAIAQCPRCGNAQFIQRTPLVGRSIDKQNIARHGQAGCMLCVDKSQMVLLALAVVARQLDQRLDAARPRLPSG